MKICLQNIAWLRHNTIYFVLGLLVWGELLSITYRLLMNSLWVADDSSFSLNVFCKVKLSFYELKLY